MSRAAKRELREKKRKKKHGITEKTPEGGGGKGVWILIVAVLIVIGFVAGLFLANVGAR